MTTKRKNRPRPTSLLHEQIARRLIETLEADPGAPLPPISEMARHYHVSYKTMLKAVHHPLVAEKVLCRKGRRLMRAGVSRPDAEGPVGSLFSKVKNNILQGIFQAGDPLPKFDFFAASEHVSRDTIAGALQKLSKENLAHKLGKRWIAGPRPGASGAPGAGTSFSHSPVILMLAANDYDCYMMFNSQHTAPFMNSFTGELMKNSMQLSVVQRARGGEGTSLMVPGGIDEARSIIRTLGDRYRGALIVDLAPTLDVLNEWLPELTCFGERPAVYFDFSHEGILCTRSRLRFGQRYFRLSFDEPAAISAALSYLVNLGHRAIGFPTFGRKGDHWTVRRCELTHRIAEALSPAPELIAVEHAEPFWYLDDSIAVDKFINFNRRVMDYVRSRERLSTDDAGATAFQHALIRHTPSMCALLDRGATAIISLNDKLAHLQYLWLRLAGVDVPRHLSMVSFDNIPESIIFPISTVDFGFTRLGYLAAHILLDDIAVQSDREGTIPGICALVDRGSAGKPADPQRLKSIV